MSPKEYLCKWICTDLSKPYKTLNNLAVCPFAKPALETNKLDFVNVDVQTFPLTVDLSNLDAVIFIFQNQVSCEELYSLAIQFNNNNPDLVALEDHPDESEILEKIIFNNGKYPIIIVQSRQKLEKYRNSLRKKGYYANWPKEMLEDLLNR